MTWTFDLLEEYRIANNADRCAHELGLFLDNAGDVVRQPTPGLGQKLALLDNSDFRLWGEADDFRCDFRAGCNTTHYDNFHAVTHGFVS